MPTTETPKTPVETQNDKLRLIQTQKEKLQDECEKLVPHRSLAGRMYIITPATEFYARSVKMHAALARCIHCGKIVNLEKMATSDDWLVTFVDRSSPFARFSL